MLTPSTVQSPSQAETNYRLGYIWTISIVAALGGLLFGYDWVVIGGAKPFFEPYFGIQKESFSSGWANSCALLGCLLGSIGGGVLTDRLGRKWLLSAAAFLFIVTSLGNALAPSFDLFITWRILGGTAIGLASGLSPLYISEIAPGTVDRIGRRPLMLLGEAGLAAIYLVLGTGFLNHWTGRPMLVLVLAAIGCYAMTLAPCAWVIISEIFPNRIRGAAMAVAVSALWIACFVLTYTFPWLEGHLGPAGVFWLYAGICLAAFVYLLCCLPETKGKTLEETERELVD